MMTNKSKISDHSSTSMSHTETKAISQISVSSQGRKIEHIDVELPSSLMNAIRIIERLLTQSKYHVQHVSYKDYPVVHIEDKKEEEEEPEQDTGKNPLLLGL